LVKIVMGLLIAAALHAQIDEAESAFRSGDTGHAAALAHAALVKDAGSVRAHLILGVIAAQNNNWHEAGTHFEAVVRLAPENPQGYFYLGQANLYQQKWEVAAKYFSAALEKNHPDRNRVLLELAVAQHEAGHPSQALASLRQASISSGPYAAQYFALTAYAEAKLGQPAEAIQAIQRARAFDAANPQYVGFLISTLLGSGQLSAALAEAIQAQRQFPDDAQVQFLFGLASHYVTHGDLTKIALRNLSEAQPESPQTMLLSGLVDRQRGQTEEATRAFLAAARGGVPDAHTLLGLIYKDAGDLSAAEREFREAERLNPQNGQVELELGKILFGRSNHAEALNRLKTAAQCMPDNAAVHYQLSLLYRKLGDANAAAEHMALYRKLHHENEPR
jgi:tetratricopeptide (TPR) repeat protein